MSNMPKNWEPPYPSYRFDPLAGSHLQMVVFGVQSRAGGENFSPFRTAFDAAAGHATGPRHREDATFTDAAGYENLMIIAYWPDRAGYQAWLAQAGFGDWMAAADREAGNVGVWREEMSIPPERFETLFSSPNKAGAAALAEREAGDTIREHGYWGGMRDRIAASAHDPLDATSDLGAASGTTLGRRITITPPENLCMIHSAQNWEHCPEAERETYFADVEPVLKAGMAFLEANGAETGCCSVRYARECDTAGASKERTFGFAYFLSMGHLEAWSKSHPTHLAIFGKFHQMVVKHDFQLALQLWHEVAVLTGTEDRCEYVNCHPATGLLSLRA